MTDFAVLLPIPSATGIHIQASASSGSGLPCLSAVQLVKPSASLLAWPMTAGSADVLIRAAIGKVTPVSLGWEVCEVGGLSIRLAWEVADRDTGSIPALISIGFYAGNALATLLPATVSGAERLAAIIAWDVAKFKRLDAMLPVDFFKKNALPALLPATVSGAERLAAIIAWDVGGIVPAGDLSVLIAWDVTKYRRLDAMLPVDFFKKNTLPASLPCPVCGGETLPALLGWNVTGGYESLGTLISWEVENVTVQSLAMSLCWAVSDGETVSYTPAISGDPGEEVVSYPVIGDGQTVWILSEYELLFDGADISDRVTGIEFSENQDQVHNEITVSVRSAQLAASADPHEKTDQARLVLMIHGREMFFLFERKKGDHENFEMWGRSPSALYDSPHSTEIDVTQEPPMSARDLAASVCGGQLLWSIPDWLIRDVQFAGTPLALIQEIAAAAGAIVRAKDNGALIVRRKKPVRPVCAQLSPSGLRYDRTRIVSHSYEEVRGSGYGEVHVTGWSADAEAPDLELEDMPGGETRYMGTPSYMRVYFKEPYYAADGDGVLDTYVTAGVIQDLRERYTETVTERLEFKEGAASVSHPVIDLKSVSWIGKSGEGVEWEKYKKELRLSGGRQWAVADVTYRTAYQRFVTTDHFVETQLAAFAFGLGAGDVSVTVKIAAGGPAAPGISNALATDIAVAVEMGTTWLDEHRYHCRKASISAPFDANARPGRMAFIDDAELGAVGNYYIESVRTVIDGPYVSQTMEVRYCRV